MKKIFICLMIMAIAMSSIFAVDANVATETAPIISNYEVGMSLTPYEIMFLKDRNSSYGFGMKMEVARNFVNHCTVGAEVHATKDRLMMIDTIHTDTSVVEGLAKVGAFTAVAPRLTLGVDAKVGMTLSMAFYEKTKIGFVFGGGVYGAYALTDRAKVKLAVDCMYSPNQLKYLGDNFWVVTLRPSVGLVVGL